MGKDSVSLAFHSLSIIQLVQNHIHTNRGKCPDVVLWQQYLELCHFVMHYAALHPF